jgi:predicted dehydrogenase
LASSFLDAQAVAEIAREKKRILQVGYFRRFHPAAHAIRALLRNGDLGEPCRCVINAGHIIASPSPLLMNLQLSGGGVVMDFGVHVIDRLVSWFDRIELAEYADDAMGEMEANALIRMRGWVDQSAIEVEARFSRTSQLGYFGTVEFEEGSVDFELNAGHSLIMRGSRQVRILDHDCPMSGELRLGPPFRGGGYFRQQFLEFAARVHGSSETWSCLSDAVQVNALVDECYAHKSALQTVYGD